MTDRRLVDAEGVASYLTKLTASSKVPGIEYVVVRADRVLFEYAGGRADIRRRVPVGLDTTMMAYSMSKTITAVAVLQLVQAGRVGLDDAVARYVDGLPYGPGVTVRQLLSHTGGVPNPIPLRWVHAAALHERFDEDVALAAVLRDHPRLSFEPGTRYAYSNIGYWLLGKVVERASGASFTAYVNEHILRPLDVPPAELGYVVSNPARHATGYLEKYSWMNLGKGFLIDRDLVGEYAGRWLEIRSHYPNGPAFGGLVGTARAFGRFLQDQLRPRSALLDESTRSLLYTPQKTTKGAPVAMTLGWHVGDRAGSRFFYKEGGGGGFHCLMRLYPGADGIGTIVMTNATGFDVNRLLDDVDRVFLRES
jgi:D-alanyl-D-alanine carboxypeptidase